jgi:hypothetical protein
MALWELIFMLVVLKIPLVYVGWVVWWAIRAEPEIGTEGGTEGVNWKPWQGTTGPRPRRGGPHGTPERRTARVERKRERIGA